MTKKRHKPPPLSDILRIVYSKGGAECLIKLTRAIGGRRIRVSRNFGDDHPIVQLCGREVAEAIAARHYSDWLDFPTGKKVVNLLIAEAMFAKRASISDVAVALGLHYTTAQRMRRFLKNHGIPQLDVKPQRDTRQIDLEELLMS